MSGVLPLDLREKEVSPMEAVRGSIKFAAVAKRVNLDSYL
jgi:hypothetical protein